MSIDSILEHYRKKLGISEQEHQQNLDQSAKNAVIPKIQEQLETPIDTYNEVINNPDSTLEQLKQAKIDQLDYLCSAEILKGFDYTINSTSYHFSLSIKAQSNFTGTNALFQEGRITNKRWTVVNNETGKIERIDLDKSTFDELKMEVDRVVDDNVSRFRDTLEPQVETATSKDDVENIKW